MNEAWIIVELCRKTMDLSVQFIANKKVHFILVTWLINTIRSQRALDTKVEKLLVRQLDRAPNFTLQLIEGKTFTVFFVFNTAKSFTIIYGDCSKQSWPNISKPHFQSARISSLSYAKINNQPLFHIQY